VTERDNTSHHALDVRARLLRAAVRFCLVSVNEPELRLLHHWLDCWRGIGDVVAGMARHDYDLRLALFVKADRICAASSHRIT